MSDAEFLAAVHRQQMRVVFIWELPWPEKDVKKKAHDLIQRGLLCGCSCGCAGRFYLTEKGRALIEN